MKTISAGLKQAILDGEIATIIKVTTSDATVYGYTDHEKELLVGVDTYVVAPGLRKIRLIATNNAEISNQELGMGWVDAPEEEMLAGKFDNALIEVQWVPYRDTSLGALPVFVGRLGVIQWTEDGFFADIHSNMRDLGRNIGEIVSPSCRHDLFSADATTIIGSCQVIEASFTYTGTITAINTQQVKFEISGSQPATVDWCTYGAVAFTSGLNNGLTFEVKKHDIAAFTTIELQLPATNDFTVGDSFSLTAGCDKVFDTCKTKFTNGPNFGGFPHIQSEIMYR